MAQGEDEKNLQGGGRGWGIRQNERDFPIKIRNNFYFWPLWILYYGLRTMENRILDSRQGSFWTKSTSSWKNGFFKFWNFQGGGSLGKQKNLSGALLELSKGKAGLSEPPPSPSPCPCAGLTFKIEREAKNPISGSDAALPHPVHISEPRKKQEKFYFWKKSVAVSIQLSNKTIIFLECHTAANMHFCLKMFKPALSENMD